MKTWSAEKISVLALVLLITGAIDSIRNLPGTALFGSTLIFFFIFSAIIFLIPVALIAAELSSTWADEEGGIYSWVKHAFGENVAFFTIWLQWINTLVWYPTILSFIAGTVAYLINPELSQNKYYLISVILTIFWSLTLIGLSGLRASAAFAGFCAVIGMIIPMGFIILLSFIWIFNGHPLAIDMSWSHLLPQWKDSQSWVSLTAIMTSFLGMELAAVHVRNVNNPQSNFPKAMFLSVLLILFTMIFGSLAIAFILPKEKISLVDGVMRAFDNFLHAYNLSWMLPLLVFLLLLGSLGSMINWIISPAKGLLMAAKNNFLPASLCHVNQKGIASRILILQAIVVTLLCSGFLLFPSVNAIYWLFTALSTELYMMMYVMMFIAAWVLKTKFKDVHRPFAIPGGKFGYRLTCILGLIGCAVTLTVGFIPPVDSINLGSPRVFQLVFSLGIVLMLIPAFIIYLRKIYTSNKNSLKAKAE
ncbi:APC family permease [Legionella waltersii]|uniref:Glutamate/gamma-aminobutyrate antiporter n=1 Tax=Legionella waltersii TaxID=66969 RepID=A0A0W1AMK5_9GAMM|nr:APC family permease [Legionella waltersii]KTD82496.1 glutamate/gamma-aminobutyrate antiporter [Legionella waltersii]SNV02876.1 Glutamate/gamma-aminobutyrate antiporter [Legionella waltersii]